MAPKELTGAKSILWNCLFCPTFSFTNKRVRMDVGLQCLFSLPSETFNSLCLHLVPSQQFTQRGGRGTTLSMNSSGNSWWGPAVSPDLMPLAHFSWLQPASGLFVSGSVKRVCFKAQKYLFKRPKKSTYVQQLIVITSSVEVKDW